ncbi:MAG TPA: hypothetical protein VGY58_07160 [Gemmataceae bacterium]|nr:hypothetical protein [Gemmataceae bacterium]
MTPDINLDTHILDVVNEMKWQELKNVVLVSHSYAGRIITGVAEQMESIRKAPCGIARSSRLQILHNSVFAETGMIQGL